MQEMFRVLFLSAMLAGSTVLLMRALRRRGMHAVAWLCLALSAVIALYLPFCVLGDAYIRGALGSVYETDSFLRTFILLQSETVSSPVSPVAVTLGTVLLHTVIAVSLSVIAVCATKVLYRSLVGVPVRVGAVLNETVYAVALPVYKENRHGDFLRLGRLRN